jgi:hypothetical protein
MALYHLAETAGPGVPPGSDAAMGHTAKSNQRGEVIAQNNP